MATPTHTGAFSDGPAYEATLGRAHRHFVARKARFLERLLDRHDVGQRLVDLGCGTGQMEEALRGSRFDVTGVDLAAPMIAHAQAKAIPRTRFLAADAANTGLPDGAFDVSFAAALFHHVPPKAQHEVAREMARVVRPGGLVVVFEHNPWNPVTRRMVRRSPVDEDAVLVAPPDLERRLREAGLRVLDRKYLIFVPHALRALAGLERALSWCPAGGQYAVVARKPEGGA